MKTFRQEVIKVFDSGDREVNIGDVVVIHASGKLLIGAFDGIGARGSWKFKGFGSFKDVSFTVAPASITSMLITTSFRESEVK